MLEGMQLSGKAELTVLDSDFYALCMLLHVQKHWQGWGGTGREGPHEPTPTLQPSSARRPSPSQPCLPPFPSVPALTGACISFTFC